MVRLLLLMILIALLPLSCAQEQHSEDPDNAARRLIVLSPALAATIRDLGLGHEIVGRHAFDDLSDPAIPTAGDQSGLDYEVILRLRPTHILLERGASDLPPRLQELAGARGWRLEAFPMLTLDDIRAATSALPSILADADAQGRAESLLAAMDEAWRPIPGLREAAGRTLLLYWTNPPGAAGPGSFHHELLEALGIEPALKTGAAFQTLDAEGVRRLDPDSIILLMPRADPSRLAELLGPLRNVGLRAVESGRVWVVNHPLGQIPCPGMVEVAAEIAAAAGRVPRP